jgi:hypothetical protein
MSFQDLYTREYPNLPFEDLLEVAMKVRETHNAGCYSPKNDCSVIDALTEVCKIISNKKGKVDKKELLGGHLGEIMEGLRYTDDISTDEEDEAYAHTLNYLEKRGYNLTDIDILVYDFLDDRDGYDPIEEATLSLIERGCFTYSSRGSHFGKVLDEMYPALAKYIEDNK